MAEARPFSPVKELGSITISPETEIKFYVDEYRGFRYGAIRTFVKRESYSGPTKAGISLNAEALEGVIAALEKLPKEPESLADKELSRIPRKAGVTLVVRITIYKDTTGVDLREWVEDIGYEGWSKKGVRIPYAELPKALDHLKAMRPLIARK